MKTIIGLVFFGLLTLPATSHAVPVPASSTVAGGLVVNFDLSGRTPAPPFRDVRVSFEFSGLLQDELLFVDVFAGLNATPSVASSWSFLGTVETLDLNFSDWDPGSAGIIDGEFSVVLRGGPATASFDLLRASATGFGPAGGGGNTGSVTGTPVNVPEPATLALLGVGLAGLGFARRSARSPAASPSGVLR